MQVSSSYISLSVCLSVCDLFVRYLQCTKGYGDGRWWESYERQQQYMDPELWGDLQHHISLEIVYVREAACEGVLPLSLGVQGMISIAWPVIGSFWRRASSIVWFLSLTLSWNRGSGDRHDFCVAGSWLASGAQVGCLPTCSSCELLAWSSRGGLALCNMHGGERWDGQLRVFDFHTRVVTHLPPSPLKPYTHKHRRSHI